LKAKVRFFGEDIGFQFSSTGMGSTSRSAHIRDIHVATDEEIAEINERSSACYHRNDIKAKWRTPDRTKKRSVCAFLHGRIDEETGQPMLRLLVGISRFRFKHEKGCSCFGGKYEDWRYVKVAMLQHRRDGEWSVPSWESWESFSTISTYDSDETRARIEAMGISTEGGYLQAEMDSKFEAMRQSANIDEEDELGRALDEAEARAGFHDYVDPEVAQAEANSHHEFEERKVAQ